MNLHELKTDPAVYDAVASGAKTFEIRLNDRGFAVGDRLLLRKTQHDGTAMKNGEPLVYTGESMRCDVTHILSGPIYGLQAGWCILSIKPLPKLGVRSKEEMILTQADINLCLGSTELLACPFCGGKPMSSGERTENGKAIRWKIQCTGTKPGSLWPDCMASVIGVDPDQDKARADAVERWNKRPSGQPRQSPQPPPAPSPPVTAN